MVFQQNLAGLIKIKKSLDKLSQPCNIGGSTTTILEIIENTEPMKILPILKTSFKLFTHYLNPNDFGSITQKESARRENDTKINKFYDDLFKKLNINQ